MEKSLIMILLLYICFQKSSAADVLIGNFVGKDVSFKMFVCIKPFKYLHLICLKAWISNHRIQMWYLLSKKFAFYHLFNHSNVLYCYFSGRGDNQGLVWWWLWLVFRGAWYPATGVDVAENQPLLLHSGTWRVAGLSVGFKLCLSLAVLTQLTRYGFILIW